MDVQGSVAWEIIINLPFGFFPVNNITSAKWFDIAANVHLEDGSKQVCCLKQTCQQTGEARKYLTRDV